MLAASLPSPGSLALVRRPLPLLGPRDVLLSVEATTLCGTDLRIVTGQKTHGVTRAWSSGTKSPHVYGALEATSPQGLTFPLRARRSDSLPRLPADTAPPA